VFQIKSSVRPISILLYAYLPEHYKNRNRIRAQVSYGKIWGLLAKMNYVISIHYTLLKVILPQFFVVLSYFLISSLIKGISSFIDCFI